MNTCANAVTTSTRIIRDTMERRRFRVTGVVQGVGFRPFVYRLAARHGLAGHVLNDGTGVLIEAEGSSLDAFAAALVAEAPPLAAEPELVAEIDDDERALLRSPERPIVLVRRTPCPSAPVARAVAPGTDWLGVMLPYTPLHHLLPADFGRPLVLTSGNVSDEPI